MNTQKKQEKSSSKTGLEIPKLLSKKWLCQYFSLYNWHSGRSYSDTLYAKVLTDTVLQQLGLSSEDVRRNSHKQFNREQSVKLIQILNIE